MAKKTIQRIFGHVDLTPEMRAWKQKEIENGNLELARGWKTVPAHHRQNPPRLIAMNRDPDCDESELYWFDNPEKRDRNEEILREPLPIKHDRDKEFFREQNAKMRQIYGIDFYKILKSRKNYIEAYVPETDFAAWEGKHKGMRPEIVEDIGHEDETVQVPVKKRGRPKKSRTETRLVDV